MTTPAVIFPVGEDRYAVAHPRCARSLPTSAHAGCRRRPPVLLGAFNLRGEVVPVFDTAVLLGIGTHHRWSRRGRRQHDSGSRGAGRRAAFPRSVELETAGRLVGSCPATLGVYAVDDGLAVLLDVEAAGGQQRARRLRNRLTAGRAHERRRARQDCGRCSPRRPSSAWPASASWCSSSSSEVGDLAELIAEVFREVHTLKGSAAVVGFEDVAGTRTASRRSWLSCGRVRCRRTGDRRRPARRRRPTGLDDLGIR